MPRRIKSSRLDAPRFASGVSASACIAQSQIDVAAQHLGYSNTVLYLFALLTGKVCLRKDKPSELECWSVGLKGAKSRSD